MKITANGSSPSRAPLALPALSRRNFLAGAATGAGLVATARPALAAPSVGEQLAGLCDRLWQNHLRRFPGLATSLGADGYALRGRLDDWSREGREDWVRAAAGAGKRLALIEASVLDRPLRLDHAVLSDHFARIAELGRRWRFGDSGAGVHAPVAPYALSPLNGPHRAVPVLLASAHPIATADDCESWIARLAAFAPALDQATTAFLADAGAGVVAPAPALTVTLAQLAELRRPDPAAHPLATGLAARAAAAGLAGPWGDRAAAILAKSVYPALERQSAAITRALPSAPPGAGAGLLPEGRAFYADALGFHTGTSLSPAEVHRMGLARIEQLNAELEPLLRRLGMTSGPIGERLAALDSRPGERFSDCEDGRAQVIRAFSDSLACAHPFLAGEFPHLPATPTAVRRLPDGPEQAGAGDPSVSRGTLYVDLTDLTQWPRHAIPTSAFCQALPGARWEAAAAQVSPAMPAIRRHGMRYPAHAAGWTLYAEHAASAQGLYDDSPAARAGYLRARLLRAARLVADTGMHHLGWSRDESAAALARATGRRPDLARADMDRAALLPGEACAQGVGESEWQRLRALAERLGGNSFDPRRFNTLIGQGRAPFAIMDEVVTEAFSPRLSVLEKRTV